METADVLTIWFQDQLEELYNSPLLPQHYQLFAWSDITRQSADTIPPDPNNYVVRITAETAVMDQIANDPNYTILEGTRGPV
jgi:hypothetical protein